jgi:hypothetical protein
MPLKRKGLRNAGQPVHEPSELIATHVDDGA